MATLKRTMPALGPKGLEPHDGPEDREDPSPHRVPIPEPRRPILAIHSFIEETSDEAARPSLASEMQILRLDEDQPVLIVGRQRDCDYAIGADDQLSRRHFQIQLRDSTWCVRDLGSTNGTFVNQDRLQPNDLAPLTDGDAITAGGHRFLYHSPGGAQHGMLRAMAIHPVTGLPRRPIVIPRLDYARRLRPAAVAVAIEFGGLEGFAKRVGVERARDALRRCATYIEWFAKDRWPGASWVGHLEEDSLLVCIEHAEPGRVSADLSALYQTAPVELRSVLGTTIAAVPTAIGLDQDSIDGLLERLADKSSLARRLQEDRIATSPIRVTWFDNDLDGFRSLADPLEAMALIQGVANGQDAVSRDLLRDMEACIASALESRSGANQAVVTSLPGALLWLVASNSTLGELAETFRGETNLKVHVDRNQDHRWRWVDRTRQSIEGRTTSNRSRMMFPMGELLDVLTCEDGDAESVGRLAPAYEAALRFTCGLVTATVAWELAEARAASMDQLVPHDLAASVELVRDIVNSSPGAGNYRFFLNRLIGALGRQRTPGPLWRLRESGYFDRAAILATESRNAVSHDQLGLADRLAARERVLPALQQLAAVLRAPDLRLYWIESVIVPRRGGDRRARARLLDGVSGRLLEDLETSAPLDRGTWLRVGEDRWIRLSPFVEWMTCPVCSTPDCFVSVGNPFSAAGVRIMGTRHGHLEPMHKKFDLGTNEEAAILMKIVTELKAENTSPRDTYIPAAM
ncbi:MAG: FHA domain-containing protein [Polyangiales bacterium]